MHVLSCAIAIKKLSEKFINVIPPPVIFQKKCSEWLEKDFDIVFEVVFRPPLYQLFQKRGLKASL